MKINTVKIVHEIQLNIVLSAEEAQILFRVLHRYAGVKDSQNIKTVRQEEIEVCNGLMAAIPETHYQKIEPSVNTRSGGPVGEYVVRNGAKVYP